MIEDFFYQTSSIINRLKHVLIVIVLFILFFAFTLYFSNINSIKGLQEVKNSNDFMSLTSQIYDKINTTEKLIDNSITQNDFLKMPQLINENLETAKILFEQTFLYAREKPQLQNYLHEIERTLYGLELHSQILDKVKAKQELIARKSQIIMMKELLYESQMTMKNSTDQIFLNIYSQRFRQIKVGVTLCFLFFLYVMTFGISLMKKISISISHLIEATDKISKGNLDYEVSILEHDEIGRLTNSFNKMMVNLKQGQNQLGLAIDRIMRLQSITASFSEALTPDQVFDIIFKHAFESLNAVSASIILVSEDKNMLELKRLAGYNQNVFEQFKSFSRDTDIPSARAIRFGQPIFYENNHLEDEFKDLKEMNFGIKGNAFAFLPLLIGSEALGSISFAFNNPRRFTDEEKEYMLALARQCAQAIHRSVLYDDAKKAIEARDEFLSIASHELRTPLTPLKLQLQSVARQIKLGHTDLSEERLQKLIETSERQIKRLQGLIDDLLDVSRITSGKMVLKKSLISLSSIIEEVLSNYSQPLRDAHSKVDFKVLIDSMGNWDKVRIEQVILNLITNALKYAPGKTIHIRLDKQDQRAVLTVNDEGPGIAKEDFERIFNRFERVASKENVGGLGLGLYISKQIVDAHHGSIFVESQLGMGSTFIVELPLGD